MKKAASIRSLRKATGRRFDTTRLWRYLCTAFLCVVAVSGVLLLGTFKGSTWKHSKEKFVVIIDAGSTGTRIYVFRYDRKDPNLHLTWIRPEAAKDAVPYRPGVRAYDRVETLPGLQTVAVAALGDTHNTTQLMNDVRKQVLGPLLNWANAVVPKRRQSVTPLRLLATAGVRGLNDIQQESLLHVLHDILYQSGYKVGEKSIEIMSGHQEGVFGWIAVNHELGTFNATQSAPMPAPDGPSLPNRELPEASDSPPDTDNDSPDSDDIDPDNVTVDEEMGEDLEEDSTFPGISDNERIAVLDLGGSSLEVTFPSKSEFLTKMDISGSSYWLESRTFEKLGLNAAFQMSLQLLTGESNATSEVILDHPCLHEGYSESVEIQSRKGDSTADPFKATLRGKPSWSQCMDLAKEVLTGLTCSNPPCFGSSADWQEPMHFIGLNGFHVVWSFFNLTNGSQLALLERRGEMHCNQTWDTILRSKNGTVQLESYCFRSAYLSMLLQKLVGYRLSSAVHVAPESVSWPIGAAYLEIQSDWRPNQMHSRKLGPVESATNGGLPMIFRWLMIAGVVILLIAVCLRKCRRRINRDSLDIIDTHNKGASKALAHFRRRHEIKRRNLSYKRLHDLSAP